MIDRDGAVAIEALEPESRDAGVAAHYGDPMREQRTLATDVGLVDRSHRGVLAVPGPERAGWLHSITTQYLADLRAGQGTELLVFLAKTIESTARAWLDLGE